MNLARRIINAISVQKSVEEWGGGYVRTSDMVKVSPQDATASYLLAYAQGPAHVYADLNAAAAAAHSPILVRRKSARGLKLAGKTIGNKTHFARYLRGEFEDKPSRKAMSLADADDMVVIEHGPAVDFLRHPSANQTSFDWRYQKFYYSQICGDFWSHVTMDDELGRMVALPMPPQYVTAMPNASGRIDEILFGRPGSLKQCVRFDPEDCVCWKLRPSRLNTWRGEGFMVGCLEHAQLYITAVTAERFRWENSQRPDFAVKMSPQATEGHMKAAQQMVDSMFRGISRIGKAIVLRDGSIQPISWSPKDSMVTEQMKSARDAIRIAFGVPESFDHLNDANLASSNTGLIQHRRNTILPMLNNDAEQDTQYLLPLLGLDPDSYCIVYRDVVPNEMTSTDKTGRLLSMNTTRSFTINELRAMVGNEAVEWGEVTPMEFESETLSRYVVQPSPAFGQDAGAGGGSSGYAGNAGGGGAPQKSLSDHVEPRFEMTIADRYAECLH